MTARTTVQKLKVYPIVEVEVEEPRVKIPYQQIPQSEQQNKVDFEEWKVGGLNSECVSWTLKFDTVNSKKVLTSLILRPLPAFFQCCTRKAGGLVSEVS